MKFCIWIKYACILLFQVVFTKYVSGFYKYDGFIFVVFVVILENVIRGNYDQIRLLYINTTKYDRVVTTVGGKVREAVICPICVKS